MTTQTEEKKPARTRDLGRVVVQRRVCRAEVSGESWIDWQDASTVPLATMQDAMAWIRDQGQDGETYRVARVGPEVKISVETVEKRSIVVG